MAESAFIQHVPCSACGSSDAGAEYDDGTAKCHKCGARWELGGDPREAPQPLDPNLIPYTIQALSARALTEETCRKWDYGVNHELGVQVANYRDLTTGKVVAQKVRRPDKSFRWVGDHSKVGLYGSWLWGGGGRKLIITEGEIDALSASQMQAHKYAVASVCDGASSAVKSVTRDLTWVESFDEVILMFDMDEPGQKAAVEVARLLSPGKAKIAAMSRKDANEYLKAREYQAFMAAFWGAKEWRPEGILTSDEVWAQTIASIVRPFASYPFEPLNSYFGGVREAEITTVGGGGGTGKSSVMRAFINHWISEKVKVGVLPLEETVGQFVRRLLGMRLGFNPGRVDPDDLPREAMEAEWGKIAPFLQFYDDRGDESKATVLDQVRYMGVALGCKIVVVDNVTQMVSSQAGDDRKFVDELLSDLKKLVKRLGISLHLVTHLRKPGGDSGRGWESGREVTLSDFRSSAAFEIVSANILGLERNQQAEDATRDVLKLRDLKCRETGLTGPAGAIRFDGGTSRFVEADVNDFVEAFDDLSAEAIG